MDGFEFNKIAGAVLTALLFIAGGRTMVDIALPKHKAEKAGWNIPVTKHESHTAKEEKPFNVASVLGTLPKANPDNGADTFKKCLTCHSPEKGGSTRVGPNLWGIVGREVGHMPGFRYSEAMKTHGGRWTWEALAKYLHKPSEAVPGNKMQFDGVSDEGDLADLLAYLGKLGDNPPPLPK
jgi:cytochrome c